MSLAEKEQFIITIASPKFKEFIEPARYKLAYGGRGGGKSVSIAKLLLLMAYEKKLRILCTREIQGSIKDSVPKLLSDQIKACGLSFFYNITQNGIEGKNGSEFIFKGLRSNINEVKSTEGIDICWIEESQSVSKQSLEILDPTIRKENSEIWFSFNRFGDNDAVWNRYIKNPRPSTKIIKINYYENKYCPKVLIGQAEHDKKTDYESYLHIWEGEPLSQAENAILNRNDVIAAMTRKKVNEDGPIVVGVDLARFGNDRTVFFKKKGFKTLDYKIYKKLDEVEIINKLKDFLDYDKTILTKIDLGYMPGVYDALKHDGYNVIGINNGGTAKDKDKYGNTISEMWFEFRDIINQVSIPNLDELKEELCDRSYGYDKKERKMVESKDQYKKRNNQSPDLADSILLAFYVPPREPEADLVMVF